MKIHQLKQVGGMFKVLETTDRSQAAAMRLEPGEKSGAKAEAHEHSDQTILVTEGEVVAEIEGKRLRLKAGAFGIIPAGTKHQIINEGKVTAWTFNVYAPPEYPPGEEA